MNSNLCLDGKMEQTNNKKHPSSQHNNTMLSNDKHSASTLYVRLVTDSLILWSAPALKHTSLVMMVMESPVGTMYELQSPSISVYPHVINEASSCSEVSHSHHKWSQGDGGFTPFRSSQVVKSMPVDSRLVFKLSLKCSNVTQRQLCVEGGPYESCCQTF